MDFVANVSVFGLLAGALAYFLLGAVWFTPLFGNYYDLALGFERPKGYTWAPIFYWMPLASAILTSAVVASLHSAAQLETLTESIYLGASVGVVALSVSLNNAVTPGKPKPILHGLVTGSYHVVGTTLVAVVVHLL